MTETRMGIIGAGDVAERHAEGLLRAGGVRLVGVAEPDQARREAFAARHGIDLSVSDYQLLLAAREIDTVLILTPHHLHAAMVAAALAAGKDVICEKPMGRTTAECDRMLDAAARARRRLFVTHSLREDFFFRTASRRLAAGALGRLLAGSFRWFTDELARLEDPAHWKGTRERSGGGVLIDGGCHVADLGNAFFGRAVRVQALGGKLVARRPEVAEDTAVFSVEYEGGAMAAFLVSFTAGSAFRRPGGFAAGMTVDVFGTEGHLEGGYLLRDGSWRRWAVERRSGQPDLAQDGDGRDRPGDIDVAIVRAMRGEAPPPLTALEARNAVAVVEAAYQSLASARACEVDWRDA